MSLIRPGLFGKLPAHGDFVHRGWDLAVVQGLDRWLSTGIESARLSRDPDSFAQLMTEAPLWRAFLPAGWVGPSALHVVLAPTVDQAGRYYYLAAGIAGPASLLWTIACNAPDFIMTVERAFYDALAGAGAADDLHSAVAAAVDKAGVSASSVPLRFGVPAEAVFWAVTSQTDEVYAFSEPTATVDSMLRLLQLEFA